MHLRKFQLKRIASFSEKTFATQDEPCLKVDRQNGNRMHEFPQRRDCRHMTYAVDQ